MKVVGMLLILGCLLLPSHGAHRASFHDVHDAASMQAADHASLGDQTTQLLQQQQQHKSLATPAAAAQTASQQRQLQQAAAAPLQACVSNADCVSSSSKIDNSLVCVPAYMQVLHMLPSSDSSSSSIIPAAPDHAGGTAAAAAAALTKPHAAGVAAMFHARSHLPSPEVGSSATDTTHSSTATSSSSGRKLSSNSSSSSSSKAAVSRVCAERPAGGLFLPQPAAAAYYGAGLPQLFLFPLTNASLASWPMSLYDGALLDVTKEQPPPPSLPAAAAAADGADGQASQPAATAAPSWVPDASFNATLLSCSPILGERQRVRAAAVTIAGCCSGSEAPPTLMVQHSDTA
jgi:uncharacterized protein YkwD